MGDCGRGWWGSSDKGIAMKEAVLGLNAVFAALNLYTYAVTGRQGNLIVGLMNLAVVVSAFVS